MLFPEFDPDALPEFPELLPELPELPLLGLESSFLPDEEPEEGLELPESLLFEDEDLDEPPCDRF